MATKVELSGGAFQDVSGNVLSLGYLLMSLSQDGQVNGSTQIAAGVEIKIALDANGNVDTTVAQDVWPNDVISPANTFYTVSAYTAEGQLVWGPNSQQVFSAPSPYNVGAWIPAETSTSSTPVVTYDVGVFFPGQYLANQVILLLPLERTVRFAVNMAPSVASCGTSPTASSTITLNKNGVQFGTLTIGTTGAATFASSSGVVFDAGDVLTVIAPAAADATLANLGILLSGTVAG
jgi:hypothetical protein